MLKYLLLTLLVGCGCSSIPTHNQLRQTALRLEFATALCSGTAVSSDTLITARHCTAQGVIKRINGTDVVVLDVKQIAPDTVLVKLAGKVFKVWARINFHVTQGERVRWFGNPLGEPDLYRVGYVSRAWSGQIIIDGTVCKGDSGSGIFNDSGEVIGVVSATSNPQTCGFMLGNPTA